MGQDTKTIANIKIQTMGGGQQQQNQTKKFRFQVKLEGQWKDYSKAENGLLTRAFLSGRKTATFTIRGAQKYLYDFDRMKQINTNSDREREIRAPPQLKRPAKPVVPAGPTMVVLVPKDAKPGDVMEVPHPMDKSVLLQVKVPENATPGATLLVLVPPLDAGAGGKKNNAPAVDVNTVPQDPNGADAGAGTAPEKKSVAEENVLDKKKEANGLGTGIVAGAAGTAVIGAALLGAGAATGAVGGDVGEGLVDFGDAVGDGARDAGEAIADFADPALEELGQFAENTGDFIMNLF